MLPNVGGWQKSGDQMMTIRIVSVFGVSADQQNANTITSYQKMRSGTNGRREFD
jgi:hypothetical protein